LLELLVVVAIIGIITAIAVPGLARAKMSANEGSAVGSMRAITSAEALFAASCAGGGFATDLADLGLAPTAGGDPFLPADLAAAFPGGTPKSGYQFTISGGTGSVVLSGSQTCNGSVNDAETEFFATGAPYAAGSTGTRFFGADASGQIRQDSTDLPDMSAGIPLQ
jgi:type II secretory pathway pseudopilin PulG